MTWDGEDLPVPGRRRTLTGVVQPGVEAGSLLLGGYLLLGGPRDVLAGGGTLRVTGRPQPHMLTTAQQGTPFVVETVEPA